LKTALRKEKIMDKTDRPILAIKNRQAALRMAVFHLLTERPELDAGGGAALTVIDSESPETLTPKYDEKNYAGDHLMAYTTRIVFGKPPKGDEHRPYAISATTNLLYKAPESFMTAQHGFSTQLLRAATKLTLVNWDYSAGRMGYPAIVVHEHAKLDPEFMVWDDLYYWTKDSVLAWLLACQL